MITREKVLQWGKQYVFKKAIVQVGEGNYFIRWGGGFETEKMRSAYQFSLMTVMCHCHQMSRTHHYGSTWSFFLPTKSNVHLPFANRHVGVLWTGHHWSHAKDELCFNPYFLTGWRTHWNRTVFQKEYIQGQLWCCLLFDLVTCSPWRHMQGWVHIAFMKWCIPHRPVTRIFCVWGK